MHLFGNSLKTFISWTPKNETKLHDLLKTIAIFWKKIDKYWKQDEKDIVENWEKEK